MPEKKSPENKPAVADALNALLADSFALYLKTKNYHWHVQGPRFRDLHPLFDEQAAQILATIDPIAERVRKNAAPTLRSIGEISRRKPIKEAHKAVVDAHAMIATLATTNAVLLATLTAAKTGPDGRAATENPS